jgi:hypothetical protein
MVDQERQQRLREARKARAGLSALEQWAMEQVAKDDHPAVSDSTREVADQAQVRVDAVEDSEIQRVFGC